MKKIALLIVILATIGSSSSWGNTYGYITKIINSSHFQDKLVRIQTTDKSGHIVKNNGQDLTGDQIQDQSFWLSDIKALNLTIPWEGWDGAAVIRVDVFNSPNLSDRKSLVLRNLIKERDSKVQLKIQSWPTDPEQTMQEICRKYDTNYTLTIAANGQISLIPTSVNKNPNDPDLCDPRYAQLSKVGSASSAAVNQVADTAVATGNKVVDAAVTAGNKIADTAVELANLANEKLIKPVRDEAHSIAEAINGIADKISSTPDTITQKASQVIGNPDLSSQLQAAGDKIDAQIKDILATIAQVQKQKEDVKKQNLAGKGIVELQELNTLLVGDATTVGVFDAVVDALNELVNKNCQANAQCQLYATSAAFKAAAAKAKEDENIIKANIQELNRKINNPDLIHDGVVESLPNRLRNMAKPLNL